MHIEEVSLKHTLTDGEFAKLAKEQANAIEKKTAAEADLGAIKKDYAGRIALAQAEVSNISQKVNSGWEMRNIKCLLVDERPEGYRLVVRTDNGHVSKRRKLNPEERQMKLTTDAPEPQPCVVSALLKVGDADVVQVPFYQDEYEILKAVQPPIQFMPIAGRSRQIEGPATTDDKGGTTTTKKKGPPRRK